MPYLPLDPQDIGRTYEAIIRVNSQSGKGGAAWIILRNLELDLPRGLQVAFSKIVQRRADQVGRELLSTEIQDLFEQTYFLKENPRFKLVDYTISNDRSASPAPPASGKRQDTTHMKRRFEGVISVDGQEHELKGLAMARFRAWPTLFTLLELISMLRITKSMLLVAAEMSRLRAILNVPLLDRI
jgi:2-isopropylmalate synthase